MVESGGFYCIDWNSEDPYLLFGDMSILDDAHQNLNVELVPCNWVGESGEETIMPQCNTNSTAQREYVGVNVDLQLLYNYERLDL